jgi:hypothetical protein
MVLTGTGKLTRGHELALQELGSGDQKSIARFHFERYLVVLYALISHFSSETKLTCQYLSECRTYTRICGLQNHNNRSARELSICLKKELR